jgi:regulatory protein
VPTVTALRARGRNIDVDLDGEPWRSFPSDVVVRAELRIGRQLDRAAFREVGRELRRHRALAAASRALRHRDLSRRDLEDRLDRVRLAPPARAEALAAVERAGLVDDERFARERALRLAERGLGNAAIRDDLTQQGVAPQAVSDALVGLGAETERAARIVARRGGGLRTARLLARRGFEGEAIAAVLPAVADNT